MRQLNPATNLLLSCLAAAGLLGTLSFPWYGAPVTDTTNTDGPVERGAFQLAHVFSHTDAPVSGAHAAGGGKLLLFGLAALIVVLCGVDSLPSARKHVRDVLRSVALLAPVLVAYLAIAHPGTKAPVTIHWGLPASVAVSLVVLSAAWHGSEIRTKKAPIGSWAQARAR